MKILITNDDGIHSDGLMILADAVREAGHDVWICAPDTERSAHSHSISLKDPVKFHEIEHQVYTCSGTPVDCVFYGLKGALPMVPDLVLSGINRGYNVGTDIIYSGTVGAARESAFHKIPSIAISAEGFEPPFPFEQAASFLISHLEDFLKLWTPDNVININVPLKPDGRWGAATPQQRDYDDKIQPFQVRDKEIFYLLSGGNSITERLVIDPGSDMDLLRRNIISVTPLYIHPAMDTVQYEAFKRLQENN